ncbi:MAG: class I SAM-dependent methyltransferase, partial [Promethearchaeota archaeon]
MNGKNYFNFISQLALPFLETPKKHIKQIFKVLEQKFGLKHNSNQKLIDLGSGDGRIIIYSALKYGIFSKGIEINSNLFYEAKEKVKNLRKKEKNIVFEMGDLFESDISDFDYIYIYSIPSIHKYLNHVFFKVKQGAIIISYRYSIKIFDLYLKTRYELIH